MKRLMLIRHAKSAWSGAGLADYDRPLNARGKRDALVIGRYLAEHGWKPDLVLCSPARRTRQTAVQLLAKFGGSMPAIQWAEALYLAGASVLLQHIRAVSSDIGTLAVIVHNPGVSELFYRLCGEQAETMPTCAVAVIDCPVTDWFGLNGGNRIVFVSPKRIDQRSCRST